jgi:hypothetical protein
LEDCISRINLGGKGLDLVELCGAKFYSVVERHGHIWEFNSESHHGSWPPSRHELVSEFHTELLPPLLTRNHDRETIDVLSARPAALFHGTDDKGQLTQRGSRLLRKSRLSRETNGSATRKSVGQKRCCGWKESFQ